MKTLRTDFSIGNESLSVLSKETSTLVPNQEGLPHLGDNLPKACGAGTLGSIAIVTAQKQVRPSVNMEEA